MIEYIMELNYEKVFKTLVEETKNYLESNKLHSMILGISGGIDSTIVAAICHEVNKQTGIPLIGRSLLIKNKEDEYNASTIVGQAFCNNFKALNLKYTYEQLSSTLKNKEDISYRLAIQEGNIQARLRMIHLYDLASQHKGIVFSTDNATEYNLGFWTLHGDVGDFNPLFGLWKTEVYGLAKWLIENYYNPNDKKEKEMIDAISLSASLIPTDGLGISNSDLEQIGSKSYEEVDGILQEIIAWKKLTESRGDKYSNKQEMIIAFLEEQQMLEYDALAIKKVTERHFNSEFKRNNLPIVINRNKLV